MALIEQYQVEYRDENGTPIPHRDQAANIEFYNSEARLDVFDNSVQEAIEKLKESLDGYQEPVIGIDSNTGNFTINGVDQGISAAGISRITVGWAVNNSNT